MQNKAFSKIWIIIILILLIVGGYFTWQYLSKEKEEVIIPEREVEDETADWQIYRNEEYGFEFSYPKEWKVVEDNLRSDSGNPNITNWGDVNDWCLIFDTGITKEEKDIFIHLFINETYRYKDEKPKCDLHEGICELLFSNEKIEIYKTNTWLVRGDVKAIKVYRIFDLSEGIGFIDYIGPDLKADLDRFIVQALSTFKFLE